MANAESTESGVEGSLTTGVPCGAEWPSRNGDVPTRDAAALCCHAEALPPAQPANGVARPVSSGCTAGVRVSLRLPCDCISMCADTDCSEAVVPILPVAVENCSDVPFLVQVGVNDRLFVSLHRADTGQPFMGSRELYEPDGNGWPLREMCAIEAGERRVFDVPLWRPVECDPPCKGPPPSGWYIVSAVLYPPQGYWHGPSAIPAEWITFCDDDETTARWRRELGPSVTAWPGGGCLEGEAVRFPRELLHTVTGVDCVWPFCTGVVRSGAGEPEAGSAPVLVYMDAAGLPTPVHALGQPSVR